MSTAESFQVAGVDGCKAGWLVAIASIEKEDQTGRARVFELRNVLVASTFTEVLSQAVACVLICVDIPIGLSDAAPRECDVAARRLLRGPRASSVFPAPVRACLAAQDYETASRVCSEHIGKKLSKQSFALLEKIRQVDDLMTPQLQSRVREIHPEISFWALNGGEPVEQNKKTATGQAQRHRLLEKIFRDMDSILAEAPMGGYAMDDALDALAAAWTAGQAVMGNSRTLPEKPELDGKGLRMEILCPGCADFEQHLD